MKIATWNVNGIRAREPQLLAWLERERPEVVCLQEIKATEPQVPATLRELGAYRCYWHGHKGYSGVALLLRRDALAGEPRFAHPDFDHETRIVTVDLGSGHGLAGVGDLVVASIYVPNGGKDFGAKIRFLEAMDRYAAEARARGQTIVLCGDLNVARTDADVHPKEQKPIIGQLPEERALFERIVANGLVDVGRALDPDKTDLFTWWAPWRNMRQRNIGWRLDYLLASEPLARSAIQCVVQADVGTSDHAPVIATFDAPPR